MPIPKEYKPLIDRLSSKTTEGKVRWQKTDYGGFRVSVSGTDFDVWSGQDQHTEIDFVSFALVEPGSVRRSSSIDSFSIDAGDEDFDRMSRLYSEARRHALGIPARLSALEKALDSVDVIGDDPPKKKGKFDDLEEDIPF